MPGKKTGVIVAVLIILLFLAYIYFPGLSPNPTPNLPHQQHGQLTGQDAISDSTPYGVGGTDLGIIVKHGTKFLYFFGDTFESASTMSGNWRSNTLAKSTDADPSDGISLDEWVLNPTTGLAKELISSLKVDYDEVTCIPTAAVSLNGILYVFYMSVIHWSTTGGIWTCNNASIAISTDDGQNFSKMTNISWAGDSNFVLFGAVQPYDESDEYLYLLSTPAGRFGSCYLCRVNPAQILNSSAYSYFSGVSTSEESTWSTDYDKAISIFSSPVGEVSVMWNEYLEKWTAFYTDNVNYAIVLRTADSLWGEWSDPIVIVDATEYPSLYGSFIQPELVEENGEIVYFIMSVYNAYNTFVMSVDLSSLSS